MILIGDVREQLATLPADHFHAVVTSPPYWALRDYGVAGQLGLEPTVQEYVANMVDVFGEVRRVLRPDGVCWVNIGDTYMSSAGGRDGTGSRGHSAQVSAATQAAVLAGKPRRPVDGFKAKDRIGVPHRLVFGLQDDGWWWRDEVVWCLSGGAWLYAKTQKGEMPMMVKDLVRLNPSTVKLWNGTKWTQVLGWGENKNPAGKVEIVLRSGERIGCTGDHLWPTQRGNVKACDLEIGDTIETCTLPDVEAESPGHLSAEAAWMIGLYLAEGSWNGDDKIQFSLNADELPWFYRIQRVAEFYGGTATYAIDGSNLTVRVYGKLCAALIREYVGGSTAHDKHLTVSAWRLRNCTLRMIAVGYLDGDGHADPKNDRIRIGFTRNYSLERDLRVLAARLGAALTLKPVISSNQTGKFPSFRGEWRWKSTGHHNSKNRGEIVDLRSSRARRFWDISVEDEPHLFALASGVLTHNCKPAPMPESVKDRTTKAHEFIFMLSKSPRYFYDVIAASEKSVGDSPGNKTHKGAEAYAGGDQKHRTKVGLCNMTATAQRQPRSVWKIATQPLKAAHFAAYPPELVRRCLIGSVSEKGCCPTCGAPWVRVTEKQRRATRPALNNKQWKHDQTGDFSQRSELSPNRDPQRHVTETVTTGWRQTCKCEAHEPVPCRVLDPFHGAGTTMKVCERLGLDYVGTELNPEYVKLSMERPAVKFPHEKVKSKPRIKPADTQAMLDFEGDK